MCKHISSSRRFHLFSTPPVLGRGYAPKRRNHHERRFFFFFSAGSAEGLWHPTPDLLPLRSTLCPALRSLLFSSFRTGVENNYLTASWRLWGFSFWLLWRLLGARVLRPEETSQAFYPDMFELSTQRAMGARQNDRGAGKEGRAILHPVSLGRLTRGVDLFIGYVDLRYGSSFEELTDLSQRPDRREVAPVRPI